MVLGGLDPLSLLDHSELYSSEEDWPDDLPRQIAFFVTGFSVFRREVLKNQRVISDCWSKEYKESMREKTKDWPGPFDWSEPLGHPQFSRAKNGAPLQFFKSIQVIALCFVNEEIRLGKPLTQSTSIVLQEMRVEAALSYINGLDLSTLEEVERADSDAMAYLRNCTGQKSSDVFYEMAAGRNVTFQLASRLHSALVAEYGVLKSVQRLGEVGVAQRARWKAGPSLLEARNVRPTPLLEFGSTLGGAPPSPR